MAERCPSVAENDENDGATRGSEAMAAQERVMDKMMMVVRAAWAMLWQRGAQRKRRANEKCNVKIPKALLPAVAGHLFAGTALP